MDGLPNKGDVVQMDDTWFYKGTAEVVSVRETPHHMVEVKILTIEDPGNQHWVGRTTWILPGRLTVLTCGHCKNEPPKGHTCPRCGRGQE